MSKLTRRIAILTLAAVFGVASTASAAGKKFAGSDDAKEADEPQTFLKNYDKLVEGSEADWVYFAGTDLKSLKKVALPAWGTTGGKPSKAKFAAESGPGYFEQWIAQSKKLGWEVTKEGADLTIEGNIFNAWEPSGGARMWGGWMANPGVGFELIGKDKSGNVVFEMRHKAKGSTIEDAVENGLEDVVKTLEKGK